MNSVYLGYCPERKAYRTDGVAWTRDIKNAQLFGNPGHALNSARCYSGLEHKEKVYVIELEIEPDDVKGFIERSTRIQKGVLVSDLISGYMIVESDNV